MPEAQLPTSAHPNSVVDETGARARMVARSRICVVGLVLLVASVLIGWAVGRGGYTPLTSEILKIVAVVVFVGSMLSLAMGMIGDLPSDR